LVGLSAAAFLASQGIRSLIIERLPASSPLPRAAFFHMRTLEMFREIGIEDDVRRQSEKEFVPEGDLAFGGLTHTSGRICCMELPGKRGRAGHCVARGADRKPLSNLRSATMSA